MSYVSTGHILGGQESRLAAANAPQDKTSMGQDAFLKILVAQLTHQDPLNPMEDKDMTAQLAQFSSLEQLTGINEGVKDMNSGQTRTDMYTAVSYIGKHVKADGYTVSKNGDEVSNITYSIGEAVGEIKVNIFDGAGAIVKTVTLGSKAPGDYTFSWDGTNDAGKAVADGTYSVGILAEDMDGKAVMVQTEVSGKVEAVVNQNGTNYIRLEDGRYLSFLNVREVIAPGSAVTEDTTSGDGDA